VSRERTSSSSCEMLAGITGKVPEEASGGVRDWIAAGQNTQHPELSR